MLRQCFAVPLLAVTLLGITSIWRLNPAAAQQILTIGTDPSAPTALMDAGNYADWRSESFIASGPYLNSLSIWFYGGTIPSATDGPDSFYSRLYINTGLGFFPDGSELVYQRALDQSHQGEYDFFFNDLAVTPGGPYTFSIFTNNCGGPGICDVPVTGTYSNPFIEFTTTDAYSDGYFMGGQDGSSPDLSKDIRFEATFTTTPEPSTVLLLATGLLALGWLVERQRRRREAPPPSEIPG